MPDDAQRREHDDQDVNVGRRRTVGAMVSAASVMYLGAIAYPVYRYLFTPVEQAEQLSAVTSVSIPASDLPPKGSALMFKFGSRPTMLIHHDDGSMVALDAICTHLGCTVAYQPDKQRIYCACHSGVYDPKTGKNTEGPPPKPLTTYHVRQRDAGGQQVVDVSRVPFDDAGAADAPGGKEG